MPNPDQTDHAPISIRKLAGIVGASRSTISRAFRDDASVRPELRARIRAEAQKLGYRPDPLVSELMTSFARRQPVDYRETLGVLWWPDRWSQSELPGVFAHRVRAGMTLAAERHGCRLTHFVLQRGGARALTRTLAARGIHGLIITPPSEPDQAAPALDWSSLSTVVIGRSLPSPGFDRVHHGHHGAMIEALGRLAKLGYRRPVLLADIGLEERMQRAYTGAFLAHGGGAPSHVLHLNDKDPARLAKKLKTLDHDVVIADTEEWVEPIRALPPPSGGRPFLVLDAQRRHGPVSGVHQNLEKIAGCAVDLLMQRRLHHDCGVPEDPVSMLIPGAWVEGETLPRAGARKAIA